MEVNKWVSIIKLFEDILKNGSNVLLQYYDEVYWYTQVDLLKSDCLRVIRDSGLIEWQCSHE